MPTMLASFTPKRECLTFSHIVFSIKLANSLSLFYQNATSFNEIPKQLEISLSSLSGCFFFFICHAQNNTSHDYLDLF